MSRGSIRRWRPQIVAGLIALLTAWVVAPSLDAQDDTTRRRPREARPAARGRADTERGRLSAVARRGAEKAELGEVAPDFELPLLEDVEKTELVASELRRVRLSSFKGKRPVVLIFGSYT